MDKTLQLDEKTQALFVGETMRTNIQAALAVEFYDTVKAGELPEDLCKELCLMWFRIYCSITIGVGTPDE